MRKLTFGTSNPHKLEEANSILSGVNIQGYTPLDLEKIKRAGGIEEIQSMDVLKIVERKARDVYAILKRPVIVEDTGLFIDELKGFPGPFVKYIVDGPGLDVIFRMMNGVGNRVARAITGVSMYNGDRCITGIGELVGIIPDKPRGDKFGWSNAFEPIGTNKTFGEMTEIEKNEISMRKIALLDFMKKIK